MLHLEQDIDHLPWLERADEQKMSVDVGGAAMSLASSPPQPGSDCDSCANVAATMQRTTTTLTREEHCLISSSVRSPGMGMLRILRSLAMYADSFPSDERPQNRAERPTPHALKQ